MGPASPPLDSTRQLDYAEAINQSGRHLLALVNDILDLSKIESQMIELEEEEVDVSDVAAAVLRLLQERAAAADIELALDVASDLPALHADERRLKQILINLLSNGVKFTPAAGRVALRITCDAVDGHLFQVTDTGIGITPEDMPKALSIFGQVDDDLDRKHQGTGLGLPLTKALVELHGGTLELHSEVGTQTTVTVQFPASRIVVGGSQGRVLSDGVG